MSRLPPQLQPLWPHAKRAHRWGARAVGAVARRATGPGGTLPHTGRATSRETVAAEPATARLHVTGPADVVRRPMPPGDPAGHWYFAEHGAEPLPERFVLELAGGRLLGPHAAVVTAGGVLDGETSHYFGTAGWREHPLFWNPRPRTPEHVAGTVAVLAARATGHNYYHFLVDALPRLAMLQEAFPGLRPDAWVVDRGTRYQRELLDLVDLPGAGDARIIEPGRALSVSADRLLVPSLPNASTLVTPETTTWLRERLPARTTEGLPTMLYVTRGSVPNTRRVMQETEILRRLERRGFAAIDPGTLSVQDQIDHFAAARVVVAPHGAALTNLTFCRPGVRVLELFAPGYVNGGYWSITSNIEDARYRYLVADTGRRQVPGAVPIGFMDDIDLSPDRLEAALDALLEDEA